MARIRIGIIGCGGIARSAHLPAMSRLRDQVTLVAAADPNEQAASAAAAPWGADAYTDGHKLLERRDIDMVLIAAPDAWHREWTEAAAAAGRHVLCEKPMATTVDDADAMIAACRRAGVHLMIGHSRRFTMRYMQVRRAIDRGEVGAVRLVRENERRAQPRTGESRGYYSAGHWTGDPEVSVGAPILNGVHETDLLRWFVGTEPVSVFCEHKMTVEGNRGVPDFLTFTVRFAGGAVGSSELCNCLPPGYPAFHQLELYGDRGALRAKDHDLISITRFREGTIEFPGAYEILLHNVPAYVREQAAFVNVITHDAPVPMPPEEARAALRLALASVESARSGRTVQLAAGPAEEDGRIQP
ncbi:MAG TPA: Gfo/Idh/MocA family oxidoreductase [bacterium]|nr:Gfo/Idh/MocA family oxidoreductase [bacterium]